MAIPRMPVPRAVLIIRNAAGQLLGTPNVPAVTAINRSYTDTSATDTFAAATGSIVASNVPTSYGIVGGTLAAGVVTRIGVYGNLAVVAVTGAYTYTPDNSAMNGVESGSPTDLFTITATNGAGTGSGVFTVTITGAAEGGVATPSPTTSQSSAVQGPVTTPFAANALVGAYANGELFVIAPVTINAPSPNHELAAAGTVLFSDGEAVTFQAAAGTVTKSGHKLSNGQKVRFTSITTTTGIVVNTDYFVVNTTFDPANNVAGTTFKVAATSGGAALTLTGNGSGSMLRYMVSARTKNGMMLNPGNRIYAPGGLVANNHGGATPDFPQGFDSLDSLDAPTGSTIQDYADAYGGNIINVHPGRTGSPLVFTAGMEGTLVSSVSVASPNLEGRSNISDMTFLTVCAVVPDAGSFRPPVSVSSKAAPAKVSQMNLGFLPNYDRTIATGAPATLTAITLKFSKGWQTAFTNGLFTRNIGPTNNESGGGYGRELSIDISEAFMCLCLDYPTAQKEALAIAIIQIGLDVWGRTLEGGKWPGGTTSAGSGCHQWQPLVVFAALALAGSPIGASLAAVAGNQSIFATTRQIFIVSQNDVELPRAPNGGFPVDAYLPYMKGTPEWGSKWVDYGSGGSTLAASSFSAKYRNIVGLSEIGMSFAMEMFTGGKAMLGKEAFFEYHRRLRSLAPTLVINSEAASALTIYMANNRLPAYPSAAPVLVGAYAQGSFVWLTYDKLLDVYTPPSPSHFDVRINGGGSAAPATAVTLATGATSNTAATVQTLTMASVAGIKVGHRVVHASIPNDCIVSAINGLILSISRTLSATIAAASNVTFSPAVVYGNSVCVVLDTPVAPGNTVTVAYTAAAARSIANTTVPSTGSPIAATNETQTVPTGKATKEMVANDGGSPNALLTSNGRAGLSTLSPVADATAYTHLLVGIRLKPTSTPVSNTNFIADNSPATTELRMYNPLSTTPRVAIFGGTIRPNNGWVGRGAGVQSTHWFRIDFSQTTTAAAYEYSIDGVAISRSSEGLWTVNAGPRTFTMQQLFPTGICLFSGLTLDADTFDGAIQEVIIHPSTTALPVPTGTNFDNSFDWGPNGENVLGLVPQYYWALGVDDGNAGVVPNRGLGGPTGTLYTSPSIDLEAVQPFRAA